MGWLGLGRLGLGPRLGWLGPRLGMALLGLGTILEPILGLVSLRILARKQGLANS